MRLAEILGTVSLATDVAMGMPAEHGLRAAAVAVRLGEITGATDVERSDAFYIALIRYLGCTADSDLAADVMGDEIAVRSALYGADFASPGDVLPRLWRAKDGVAAAVRTIALMPRLMNTATSHCEVGERLAQRFGFGGAFRKALVQVYERWDGKGWPHKLRGEALATAIRLAHAGEVIETAHRTSGVEGAVALAKKRAGKELDPKLVEMLSEHANDVCAVLDVPSAWNTAMDAEPRAWRTVDDAGLDDALLAIGHFADLKSLYTRTHASGVASLVRASAERAKLDADTTRNLARAALVHDIGRVAVSASVWDKRGPLTDLEWERVRTHTYVGERLLARAPSLAAIAKVATLAHERLDGGGYHRKLDAASCKAPARLLGAADAYHAMIEERPHRAALAPDAAAKQLEAMGREGTLCPDAVAAVLSAAGHARSKKKERPSGLTDREIDVLRLVARGKTNKEIAVALEISPKTAGNHLQNIYEKIGVTTRSAAAMFAMQEGLLE
jgi:HD-GYP domain-containing protein (c-di-GMP phosphodiesterase class II)